VIESGKLLKPFDDLRKEFVHYTRAIHADDTPEKVLA
jgi:hypothetical protein